jgi:hypothetical protein
MIGAVIVLRQGAAVIVLRQGAAVIVLRQGVALEDAIEFHAFAPLEALACV